MSRSSWKALPDVIITVYHMDLLPIIEIASDFGRGRLELVEPTQKSWPLARPFWTGTTAYMLPPALNDSVRRRFLRDIVGFSSSNGIGSPAQPAQKSKSFGAGQFGIFA